MRVLILIALAATLALAAACYLAQPVCPHGDSLCQAVAAP